MKKLLLQINTTTGAVTDWQNQSMPITIVNGDTVLVCCRFLEALSSTLTALNLTGALALRATIRETRDASDTLLAFQDSYNQADYPAGEVLASGYVTWALTLDTTNVDTALGTNDSMTAWLEITYLDAASIPTTLCQVQVTLVQQLDDGAGGTPTPTSPTYSTAAEIAAAYALKVGAADIEITDATKGLILRDSVTNHRIRITIADGALTLADLGTP